MRAILSALLAAAAVPAAAAPITVNVRAVLDDGPLAGRTVVGSFSFDDASLVDGEGVDVPLLSVGGDFAAYQDAVAPVGLAFIVLEGARVLDIVFGGAPSGFGEVAAGSTFDFLLDTFSFAYTTPGSDRVFEGDPAVISAPAPAVFALFGLGVVALAARRRA